MEVPAERADHQPTAQPHTTTPKRGMWRAFKRTTRAAAHCICPCFFRQKKKKDSLVNDTPFNGVLESVTPPTSDKKANLSPSSTSDSKSSQLSSASSNRMKRSKTDSSASSFSYKTMKRSMTDSSEETTINVQKPTSLASLTCASEPSQLSPVLKESKIPSSASSSSIKGSKTGSLVESASSENKPSTSASEPSQLSPAKNGSKTASSTASKSMKLSKTGSSVEQATSVNKSASLASLTSASEPSQLSAAMKSKTGSSDSFNRTSEPSPPSLFTNSIEAKSLQLSMESLTFHQLLGEGTYGKVFLASHTASKERMAVKIVKKRYLIRHYSTQALIERQVLVKTRHNPFVTHLLGSFQTELYLFYAMEYLSGGDLVDLIYAKGPLSGNNLRIIMAEIVCGLQYLHTLGIVHRDIKPPNILLDSASHAKIADFGLAAMGVFESTKITGYVGTYYYMAPEIFQYKPYDSMVDYFALGITAYEVAVGSHPYDEDNMNEQKMKLAIITSSPCYPPDMDTDVVNLIERLMEKDQDKRREILSDIREHPFFQEIKWAEVEKGEAPPLSFSEEDPKTPSLKRLDVTDMLSSEDKRFPIPPEEQHVFHKTAINTMLLSNN